MDIRYPAHPDQMKRMDTGEIREAFLVDNLFPQDRIKMIYSHIDRVIVGGMSCVGGKLELPLARELGVDYFLQRREMGIINIGAEGIIGADGADYPLAYKECLYLGAGSRQVVFGSVNPENPAKFYFLSAPAHTSFPTRKITIDDCPRLELGDPRKANVRTIHQLIHPKVLPTCQLVMGLTVLAPGSVWNTMPVHTHDRRMEVYLYCDLPEENVVFHFIGKPQETRHLVVRNGQAVISPSWSIHSGAGTSNYSFIWGMAGENQTFTDMDEVPMRALK